MQLPHGNHHTSWGIGSSSHIGSEDPGSWPCTWHPTCCELVGGPCALNNPYRSGWLTMLIHWGIIGVYPLVLGCDPTCSNQEARGAPISIAISPKLVRSHVGKQVFHTSPAWPCLTCRHPFKVEIRDDIYMWTWKPEYSSNPSQFHKDTVKYFKISMITMAMDGTARVCKAGTGPKHWAASCV